MFKFEIMVRFVMASGQCMPMSASLALKKVAKQEQALALHRWRRKGGSELLAALILAHHSYSRNKLADTHLLVTLH
jgi:hypothetical protein